MHSPDLQLNPVIFQLLSEPTKVYEHVSETIRYYEKNMVEMKIVMIELNLTI